jgi:hypothetical protein
MQKENSVPVIKVQWFSKLYPALLFVKPVFAEKKPGRRGQDHFFS